MTTLDIIVPQQIPALPSIYPPSPEIESLNIKICSFALLIITFIGLPAFSTYAVTKDISYTLLTSGLSLMMGCMCALCVLFFRDMRREQ